MNKITKIILGFAAIAFPNAVSAAITDGKFGAAQIFDVQYYWSGNDLHASNFIAPYDQNFSHPTVATGDYFQFFNSTTTPGTYGLGLYDSTGALKQVVHETGSFNALGNGAIFYIGSGFFGTVITTGEGFNYGDGAVFTAMDNNVDTTDLAGYAWASVTPLAAGQTAASTGGGSAPPAPIYLSSITTSQSTTRASNFAVATGNQLILGITGDDNTVDVQQLTNGQFADIEIGGDGNTVTTEQSSSTLSRHYIEADILGDSDVVTMLQTGAAKNSFVDITGNDVTLDVTQQGAGSHYVNLLVTGDNHDIDILQEGAGNHSATLELANGGGNWDFSLTQSGSTNQLYSLPHNLSDNTVVTGTCYTSTCVMNIVQQ